MILSGHRVIIQYLFGIIIIFVEIELNFHNSFCVKGPFFWICVTHVEEIVLGVLD